MLTTINSRAENENPDMVLGAGKPAPFSGVLVSEPRYRAYSEAVTLAELYQTAPALAAAENDNSFNNYLLAGAGGLVVGLVSGVLLMRSEK